MWQIPLDPAKRSPYKGHHSPVVELWLIRCRPATNNTSAFRLSKGVSILAGTQESNFLIIGSNGIPRENLVLALNWSRNVETWIQISESQQQAGAQFNNAALVTKFFWPKAWYYTPYTTFSLYLTWSRAQLQEWKDEWQSSIDEQKEQLKRTDVHNKIGQLCVPVPFSFLMAYDCFIDSGCISASFFIFSFYF